MNIFKGKWISNKVFSSTKIIQNPNQKNFSTKYQNQHILFRDYFEYNEKEKVVLRYCADDFADVFLNGIFIDQGPAISYPFHQRYKEIDITKFLRSGKNLISFHCYYQGLINRAYYSGDLRSGIIFDVIQNKKILCCSSEKTLCQKHSGFLISHIAGWIDEKSINYNTDFIENYDFNSNENEFDKLNFDDKYWKHAFVKEKIDYSFSKCEIKNLVYENIKPILIDSRRNIFDLKQEIVGYINIVIQGQKGQKIKIYYGEELNQDGSVRFIERCNCRYEETITLSGHKDSYQAFTYKAFRYVQIKSDSKFKLFEIKGIARHYPFVDKLQLKFKNPKLNKIYKLCANTIKYGVQDSFLDCPSREKGQYFGDGVYSSLTHLYLTKDSSLYKKFIDDAFSSSKIDKCLTAQGPCSYYQTIAEFPLIIIISLKYYFEMTHDYEFLKEQKNNVENLIKNYYKKYFNKKEKLISVYDRWNLVEWPQEARDDYDFNLPQNGITKGFHNVINAYWILSLQICLKLYKSTFGIDLNLIQKKYLENFYSQKNNSFVDTPHGKHVSLPSMVLGNLLNLKETKNSKKVLTKMIEEKRLNHSNLFITPLMFLFLKENKNYTLLNDLITKKNGWLNMIKEGGTTTFEAFSKDKKWNTSLLHTMFAFPILFMKK